MKNIIISTVILFGFFNLASGQSSNNISNIQWQADEAREVITITYDLAPMDYFRSFEVSITAMLDGRPVTTQTVVGDVGPYIEAGRGKKAEWKYFQDVPNGLQGILEFEIQATNVIEKDTDGDGIPDNMDECPFKPGKMDKGGCPPSVPWWAGMAPVAATGITLTTAGLTKQSQATQALDNEYPALASPLSSDFDPAAANNLYDQLKKDYKKGTMITIGGAIVLGAAGIIVIRRLLKDKKRAQDHKLDLYPNVQTGLDSRGNGYRTTAGIGLKYRF